MTVVEQLPDASVDHVITDWPFAIDMDNLQQSGGGMDVSEVKQEHDVDRNKALQKKAITQLFRVLKPNGFFIHAYSLSGGFKNI